MNAREWLEKLVSFDTTSRNSNMALINFVHKYLQSENVECHLTHSPNEEKANLFATIPAGNGNKENGLILSGHTDVVPVDGQDWESDPFELIEKDGRYFGRGTTDMKSFIAVALALVPEFKAMQLQQPLHFAFSFDEEIGCKGAPYLIDNLPDTGYRPKACVVGEPTEMLPIVAHKGIQAYRCTIKGLAAHSSLTTKGCNAIEYAARLICYLRQIAEEHRSNGPYDEHFDVPHTTVTTNMIQGGIAGNIIPEFCEFTFEFRNLPVDAPESVEEKIRIFIEHDMLSRMQKEYPEASVNIEKLASAPGLAFDENINILKMVRDVTDDDDVRKAAYATEAGLFQNANIQTVLCGPGSIEQAHKPNEFIATDQLDKCEVFLKDLVAKYNS